MIRKTKTVCFSRFLSEKGKSSEETEVETLKPETAEKTEENTWFRYNDGSLNYIMIEKCDFWTKY